VTALAPRITFGPVDVERRDRPDGAIELRSRTAPARHVASNGVWLRQWAAATPEAVFLAERDGAGNWRRLTYGEALRGVRRIGQALLDRRLARGAALAILSDNSVDNALLQLAANYVGVPIAPISVGYSLLSEDFARLRHVIGIAGPGLIYAEDGRPFARALAALAGVGAELVVGRNPPEGLATTPFAALLATEPADAVDAAFAAVGPDTIAKLLFTSGSTGMPKAAVNTQRMICSNQAGTDQVWPFVKRKRQVTVNWLPWNHTFGGNYVVNFILSKGGTLYIDDGRPTPERIGRTIATLREVSPTIYMNVPRGYDVLVPHLESDSALCATFFRDLDLLFYAGASLPAHLWERLQALAKTSVGHGVPMSTSWGMTETGPMHTVVHAPVDRAGNVGTPLPGAELKLLENGGKLELRARGPNVTPGYWQDGRIVRDAFDEEGWLISGDAVQFADPDDPNAGLIFDGRVVENFKLLSGTWVHVDALRVAALAALAPIAQDAVVTGHDRDEIGLLVFPSVAGCRGLDPALAAHDDAHTLLACPGIAARVRTGLAAHNQATRSSSRRIARVLLMTEPPSADANEITDKGYINQRAVLERRKALVERLYGAATGDDAAGVVIVID
jgi:feruloyl-CoA synthase